MAVLGRLLVSSAERLDLPDLLSLDSYAAGDWKYFLKGFVGDSRPYILKGFDIIDPQNAIGTQGCSIRVADSVVFYPGSSSGAFFHGLQEGHVQASPLVPELRKNAVNYVYLTLSTFNTSVDTRAFWDPDKDGGAGGEFTQDINTESVLKVDVNVSTGSFPANTIPVAKITVGPVTITAIEDARDLMFRLGSGGISPNPFNQFTWRSLPSNPYQRAEPPTQMTAGGVNPFQGADKNINTLKEWMDAVMSKLRELGGTTYWYEDTSTFGIVSGYFDAVGTAFKSKGQWSHDASTPGFLTWSEDLNIKMTSDPRTYIVRQGNKTLADEQVMYVPMIRNQPINATDDSVTWTNGQAYINTVGGAVGLFSNLAKGDWIKKSNDSFDKWVRVEEFYDAINLGGSTTTAANARSIRLSVNYLGTTGVEKARYDKGAYLASDVVVSDRNNASIYNAGGNFHWLAMRSDTIQNISNIVTTALSVAISEHDGNTAKVIAAAHGLVDGDRVTITGTTNFNGTYIVEVETTSIFYITKVGSILANESGSAFYATVTTAARSTAYGFQEESANHGLKSNDSVAVSNTTNFNGTYEINVRSSTQYTIPVSSNIATETSGKSTLARIIVRTEGAISEVVQGQIIDIGDVAADNLRQYVGMTSLSETSPTYSISGTYNTLNGMVNYNSIVNENLTARVSKLSAMMADKAQDKTIKYIPSNITSITNTTNGAAQEITFSPNGSTLTLVTPGSTGNAVITLPNIAPGISLLANQLAYVIIDRNNTSTPSIVVSSVAGCPVGENIFVIAVRLSGTDVYLWDGSLAGPKSISSGIKIIGGGTISLSGTSLSFSNDMYLEIKGLAYTDNFISTTESPISFPNDKDVAYVIPNLLPGGPSLSIIVGALSTVPANALILARRDSTDIIVGSSSTRLKSGQSTELYAQMSNENLTFIGAGSTVDFAPNYSTNHHIIDGDSLVTAIGKLDTALDAHLVDTVDAHDASAISNIPSGNLSSTDVQAALNELQGDIDTNTLDILKSQGAQSIASSGGITTLIATDPHFNVITGTLNHTFKLPSTATLQIGNPWAFLNKSTGDVVIQDFTSSTLITLAPNEIAYFRVLSTGTETWTMHSHIDLVTTSTTIANNQVTASDVTNLLISGSRFRSFSAIYWVYRTTNTNEVAECGIITGVYKTTANTWQISIGNISDDAQVDFTITAAGQVQYTSSNLSGTSYTGNIKYRITNLLRI